MGVRHNRTMTDGDPYRRPSWYSGDGGAQPPPNDAVRPADPALRPRPSAAEAGRYGVPQPGYPPYGYTYPGHPGYAPTPGYSPTPGTDELNRMHRVEADRAQSAATAALVLSIIGFFTMPFVLGPLAIWQASKARRLGHAATAGWVLGWICTLWGIGMIAGPILLVLLMLAM